MTCVSKDGVIDGGGARLVEPSAQEGTTLRLGSGDGQWFVFRTLPRREKKAADLLENMGLSYYLPLREQVTRRGRRRFSSRVPLFPGYVFGCCDIADRLSAMQSGIFVQWIDVKDQSQLLSELRGIHIAVEVGAGAKLYPRLQKGQWVRVVSGPLQGMAGQISRRNAKYRIVLDLTALQAAVAVEVDMQDVELLDEPARADTL